MTNPNWIVISIMNSLRVGARKRRRTKYRRKRRINRHRRWDVLRPHPSSWLLPLGQWRQVRQDLPCEGWWDLNSDWSVIFNQSKQSRPEVGDTKSWVDMENTKKTRTEILRHVVYAEKVPFQLKSRLFRTEKVVLELKSHLFSVILSY